MVFFRFFIRYDNTCDFKYDNILCDFVRNYTVFSFLHFDSLNIVKQTLRKTIKEN